MPFLEKDRKKLYYEVCGTGSPVVLLHGLCADSASWLTVKRSLSKHHQLIIPDNSLSGKSSYKKPPLSIAELAEDVKALLDSLGIKRAVIVGHSMGGYVAQEFAIMHPEATAGLLLESTAQFSSRRNNALFSAFAALLEKLGHCDMFWRALAPWLLSSTIYEQKPEYSEVVVKAIRDYPLLPSVENFRRQIALIASYDSRGRLGRVSAPCLVMSGARDILVLPEESRALASAITGSRFLQLPDLGHTIHFESPEEFAEAALMFLGGVR